MDILFKRDKDRETANSESKLRKQFRGNERRANLIRARLDELADAENLEVMRHLPQASCHELKADRKGQLAVKLDHGFRLIFEPGPNPPPLKPDGGLDWSRVTPVLILELAENYHGE